MGDVLATLADKINKAEEKVKKLDEHIETIISSPSDDSAVEALAKKLRFKDGDAALEYLRAEKVRLEKLLILDKEKEARLQHQGGAGT
jgi:hypothetical protein